MVAAGGYQQLVDWREMGRMRRKLLRIEYQDSLMKQREEENLRGEGMPWKVRKERT